MKDFDKDTGIATTELEHNSDADGDVDNSIYPIKDDGKIDPSLLLNESAKPVANTPQKTCTSFESLELDANLLKVIQTVGWKEPTPVQALCLPYTLAKTDVAGFAQTGTGKTGVFLITFANSWMQKKKDEINEGSKKIARPFSIVLAPTRELAIQIQEDAHQILNPIGAKSIAVYGGIDYEKQADQLTKGVDLIVATPGRLIDFYKKKIVSMQDCQLFVCDEVDRMFDMGFIEDVEFFLEKLPEDSQKLLLSATSNEKVKELAFEYLNKPEYISVSPEVLAPEHIEQHAILCDSTNKLQVILGLLQKHQPHRAIIFSNTKLVAQWLHYKLKGNGISSDLITGDLPQRKRINLIKKIKRGDLKILIATDVASRGLHVSDITHVYNFDIPDEAANYVHRIGRTARAGAYGASYSLICEEYGENFERIKTLLGDNAPSAEWFDPSFLEITDKAGNPFDDNFGQANTKSHNDTRKKSASPSTPSHAKTHGKHKTHTAKKSNDFRGKGKKNQAPEKAIQKTRTLEIVKQQQRQPHYLKVKFLKLRVVLLRKSFLYCLVGKHLKIKNRLLELIYPLIFSFELN
ncbi:MAG: DEAD/DEAH box helicase [Bdellovibrionota bacterium]